MVPPIYYLVLSGILFSLGVIGVLIRRNALVVFMSVELMLNAANLALVTFSSALNSIDTQMVVFFVITIAAAEVAVGLAILVTIFQTRQTTDIDDIHTLKG